VNVSLQANKLSFLSIPLTPNGGNYNITNSIVLSDAQDGAALYIWTGTGWNPNAPSWLGGYGWDSTDVTIPSGVGFFITSKANSTLTFVGDVPQGAITYNIPAGLSTLANKVPVSANFPGATIGHDGDSMFTWNQAGQKWSDAVSFLGGYGWDGGTATTNGPALDPAAGAFYVNTGTAIPFTQNFTVQ
jgi:hypothetical protein